MPPHLLSPAAAIHGLNAGSSDTGELSRAVHRMAPATGRARASQIAAQTLDPLALRFPTGPHLGYWGRMRDANKAQLEFTLIAFLTIPPMIYSLWRGAMALIGAD
jgi:hypothetical protein